MVRETTLEQSAAAACANRPVYRSSVKIWLSREQDIIEVDIGRSDTPPLEGMSRCAVPHDPHGKSFTRSCSTGQDVHVSSITSGRNDHGGSECGDGKGDVCCCHEGGSGAHVAGVGVVDEKAGGAKGTGHYDRCVNPTEVSREGEESDQRRHWQAQEEQRAALEGVGSSQGQEFMRTAGQRSSCQCVLTYEGEITGLAGYVRHVLHLVYSVALRIVLLWLCPWRGATFPPRRVVLEMTLPQRVPVLLIEDVLSAMSPQMSCIPCSPTSSTSVTPFDACGLESPGGA